MKSATAIAFDYRASRWLLVAIVLMAALALAAIVLNGMPTWSKIACGILACTFAGFALGRCLRPLLCRAVWQQTGHWRVADAGGREFNAELIRGVARGAWIVLNLRRSDGKNLALILGPDNCDMDTRRRLRVRLAHD